MNNYSVEATPSTPFIHFDMSAAALDIKGRSIPENSVAFYTPLFSMVDHLQNLPPLNLKVSIHLEYYNSSSAYCILKLFKKLEELHQKGTAVFVTWYYEEEDEDAISSGKNYQKLIALPFELVRIQD